MPIYEYECADCRTRFEVKRSFSEEYAVACPKCQGRVRRVFTPTAVVFNGPGFYTTDSRGKDSSSDGCSSCTTRPT
jgi:putative FmdB family regulatory protein